ncbi:hypothetical protein QEN19_001264 [Hanseniaspora menglaensis]
MLCYDEVLPATTFKKTLECDNILENETCSKFLLALTFNNDLKIFKVAVKSSNKIRISRMASSMKEKTNRDPPVPVLELFKEIKLDSSAKINDILIIKNNNKDFDKIAIILDDKISIIQYDQELKNFETRSLHQYGFATEPIDAHADDAESTLPYNALTVSKNGKSDNGILLWRPNSLIYLNLLEANKVTESSSQFKIKRRKFNPVSKFLKLSSLTTDLCNIIDIKRRSNKLMILYAPRGTSEPDFAGTKNKLKLVSLTLNDLFFDQHATTSDENDEVTYTTILNYLSGIPDEIHTIFCIEKNYVLLGESVVTILDENLNANYCIPVNESYDQNLAALQFNQIIDNYKKMNLILSKKFSTGIELSSSVFIISNLFFKLTLDNDRISDLQLMQFLNKEQLPYNNVYEVRSMTLFNTDDYYKSEKFLNSTNKKEEDIYDSLLIVFNRGDTAMVEVRKIISVPNLEDNANSLKNETPIIDVLKTNSDVIVDDEDLDLYGDSEITKSTENFTFEVKVLNPSLEPNYSPMTNVISATTLGFYKQQQLAISPNFSQEDLLAVGPSYNTVYEIILNKQHYHVKKVVKFIDSDELFNLGNKYLVTTSKTSKSSILRIGGNNNFSPILRLMDFQYDSKTLACGLCKSLRYFIQVSDSGVWILDMDSCKYKNKYIFKYPIFEADTLEDYINVLETNGKTTLLMVGKNRMKPVMIPEPAEINKLFISMTKLAYLTVNGVKAIYKICLTASDKLILFDVSIPRAPLFEFKNISDLPNDLEIVPYESSQTNDVLGGSTNSVSITNFAVNGDVILITTENLFVTYNHMIKTNTKLMKNINQESYLKTINEYTFTIGIDTLITNKAGDTKSLGHLAAVINLDSVGNVFLIDSIGVARLVNVNDFFKHTDNVIVHRLPFPENDIKQRMFGSIKYLQSENLFAASYIDQNGGSGITLLEYSIEGKFKIIEEYVSEFGYVVGCLNSSILKVNNVGADAILARNAKDETTDNELEIIRALEKNMRKIVRSQEEQVIPLNIVHNKKVQLESSYINLHLPKLTTRSVDEVEFLVVGENELAGEFDLSRSRVKLFSINREENPYIDLDYEKEYKKDELETFLSKQNQTVLKLEFKDTWDSAKGLITNVEEISGLLSVSYSDGKTFMRRCLSSTIGISSNNFYNSGFENLLTHKKRLLEPVAFLENDSMPMKIDTLGEGIFGVLDLLKGWSLYGLETEPYKILPFSKENFENDIIMNSFMNSSHSTKSKLIKNVVTVDENDLNTFSINGSMFGYNGKLLLLKFLDNGVLKLLEFDPENSKSINGTNLILHQRYKVTNCMVNTVSTIQQDTIRDDYSNNDTQFILCCTEEGKIFKFNLLPEITFKKLSILQQQIILKTIPLGGFNHKMEHEYNNFNKNNFILDLQFLKEKFIFNNDISLLEKEKLINKIFGISTSLQELLEDVAY